MLLWATKFATVKLDCGFEMDNLSKHLCEATIILLVMEHAWKHNNKNNSLESRSQVFKVRVSRGG